MPNVADVTERTRQQCLADFWQIIAEAEAHLAVASTQDQPGTTNTSRPDTTTTPAVIAFSPAR
jgi:hypothetical protein